jgi:hypothetical protein
MKSAKSILFFFLLIAAMGTARLEAQKFPSLDADLRAYDYARHVTEKVYWRDLAEAALWASAVNAGGGAEEKAQGYLEKIIAAAVELQNDPKLPSTAKEKGEYVLLFLHKRFLKAYSEHQTRVDEIFVSGRYNCVSSAVLYMVVGLSVGLDIEAVMTKDHAFITLNAGAEPQPSPQGEGSPLDYIDIETTNQYGFDPGNRKEFQDAFGKATGYAYVPARNYRDRTLITKAELVSLILSNRIAAHEKSGRYSDAVPLAVNRAAFLSVGAEQGATSAAQNKTDFFEDPRRDIVNRLLNLGANLLKTGKEDEALAWAEYAGARFPDKERWQEFIKAAANNKLAKLIRQKKTPEARAALVAMKPQLSGDTFTALDAMVLESEAADRINGIRNPGDAAAALAFLADAWERLPPAHRDEMRTVAILGEADRLIKARDFSGGILWLKSAMEKYGGTPRLENALRIARQNRVSELHNEFAGLFNKKDYTGAKLFIEKALQEFPGEKQLLNDLNLTEKALAQ